MGNEVENSASAEPQTKEKKSKGLLIIIVILLVLLIGTVAGATVLLLSRDDSDTDGTLDAPVADTMGYEASVITDEEALARALAEMEKVADDRIVLELNTAMISKDGENIDCYLANAAKNNYDLYFQIYDDASGEMIYQSGLIPIASHIEMFKSTKKFEEGTYSISVYFIEVEDDHITEHARVGAGAILTVY